MSKFVKSKKIYYGILIVLFAFLFLCSSFTPYHADDFFYQFDITDNTLLDSVTDIIPSMKEHARFVNGRLVVHALVQLFEMLPKAVFNIVNSLVFLALLREMAKLSGVGDNNAALLCLFGALIVILPNFGEVFFWLDGSVNYLWAITLNLAFILPYYRFFTEERERSVLRALGLTVFGLFAGALQETASAAAIFINVLFLLAARIFHKKKTGIPELLPIVSALAGLLFMATRPAEIAVKTYGFDLAQVYRSFVSVMNFFRLFAVPILVFVLAFTLCVVNKCRKERLICAAVFFLGFLCANCMMVAAAIYPERTSSPAAVFLIIADAIVLFELAAPEYRKLTTALISAFLSVTVFLCAYGVIDIFSVYAQFRANEKTISEYIANGESGTLQLPTLFSTTKYSVAYRDGFPSPEVDTNRYMAQYYGVDSILGYDFYSQFYPDNR